jgi:iron-sulfur cluster assembly protein
VTEFRGFEGVKARRPRTSQDGSRRPHPTASLDCSDRKQPRKEVSALLALTDSAVEAVKDIVSSSDVPETGGLRMVAEQAGTRANFQLSVVPLPAEDDEVIDEQGARVFLEPEAASLLDDKILDADVRVTNEREPSERLATNS